MEDNNWLTVREMANLPQWGPYSGKIVHNRNPRHMYNKLTLTDDYTITNTEARLQITRRSFKFRAAKVWNEMTGEMRSEKSLAQFKSTLKGWIKDKRQKDY